MRKMVIILLVVACHWLIACDNIIKTGPNFDNEVRINAVAWCNFPQDHDGFTYDPTKQQFQITLRIQKVYEDRGPIQEVNLDYSKSNHASRNCTMFFNEGWELSQAYLRVIATGTASYEERNPMGGTQAIIEEVYNIYDTPLLDLQSAGSQLVANSAGRFAVSVTAEAL